MPESTLTLCQNRPKPYARVDLNPMPESTLSPSQGHLGSVLSLLCCLGTELGRQVKKAVANLKLYPLFILFRCKSVSDFRFWRQSRSGSGSYSQSQVLHMLKNQIFSYFYSQQCLSALFYLSCQRNMFNNFNILNSLLKYSGKSIV